MVRKKKLCSGKKKSVVRYINIGQIRKIDGQKLKYRSDNNIDGQVRNLTVRYKNVALVRKNCQHDELNLYFQCSCVEINNKHQKTSLFIEEKIVSLIIILVQLLMRSKNKTFLT